MKTIKFAGCIFAFIMVFGCASQPAESRSAGPVFDWNNKPALSAEQQELLHLYTNLGAPFDEPKLEDIRQKIERLEIQLSTNVVRHARPNELVVSRYSQSVTNVAKIYNPSKENVAFTVSIKGDEEWMGSRKASMGRTTFLLANGTLLVTNLYWTTPAMTYVE